MIDGQGDGAARFFTCVTAGSAFTKPVQQLGQSRGGRSSTGTSGPASLRTFIIRIHAGTVVKATVKLSPCRRSSAHICESLYLLRLPEAVVAHGVGDGLAPPMAADGAAAVGRAAASGPSSGHS